MKISMKKKVKKGLVYVATFVFAVLLICFGARLFMDRGWVTISADYLDGLRDGSGEVLVAYSSCMDEGLDFDANYLRTEGGKCFFGYWVEINEDGGVLQIRDEETLINRMGEIDTPEKAVTLIASTRGDLSWGGETFGAILNGSYKLSEKGIYVKFFHDNTFGCGKHIPYEEIVLVSLDGDVESIYKKTVYEFLYFWIPEVCVD